MRCAGRDTVALRGGMEMDLQLLKNMETLFSLTISSLPRKIGQEQKGYQGKVGR